MIPKHFIQDLLSRIDIVDVVNRHVPLKKTGVNHSACCPFHNEKSPSFKVNQQKGFYHCFGCGAHGSAIQFLMEYLGMSFVEAVEDIANGIGMAIPKVENNSLQNKKTSNQFSVMQTATQFFQENLTSNPDACTYLEKLGITSIIDRFGIGYAPNEWNSLKSVFKKAYNTQELVDIGLVIKKDDGKRYDRFRNRVMFPVMNSRGHTIAYLGNVIDQSSPKLVLTPNSGIFEKEKNLFGLFQAHKSIRDHQSVFVLENYLETLILAQNGIDNSVSTLGSNITSSQIQKVLKMSDRVVYVFKSDKFGKDAAWLALQNTLPVISDGNLESVDI